MNTLVEPIIPLHDPDGRASHFLRTWKESLGGRGVFALCAGSTECSDLEGISAAGADGPSRRLTPAIDAEALVLGRAASAASIPVSPDGIASPVVLTRAGLNVLDMGIEVFDCGAFHPPAVEHHSVSRRPGRLISRGQALPYEVVRQLYARGLEYGRSLATRNRFLIVGECVPGGTTTAMAVLTALGYPARFLASSSMPIDVGDLRWALVEAGLSQCGYSPRQLIEDPLLCVSAVGDPMQAFAAGLVIGAGSVIPVVLGGGTQMLAVWAVARSLGGHPGAALPLVAVVTTRWVAFDRNADVGRIARMVDSPSPPPTST